MLIIKLCFFLAV